MYSVFFRLVGMKSPFKEVIHYLLMEFTGVLMSFQVDRRRRVLRRCRSSPQSAPGKWAKESEEDIVVVSQKRFRR